MTNRYFTSRRIPNVFRECRFEYHCNTIQNMLANVVLWSWKQSQVHTSKIHVILALKQ